MCFAPDSHQQGLHASWGARRLASRVEAGIQNFSCGTSHRSKRLQDATVLTTGLSNTSASGSVGVAAENRRTWATGAPSMPRVAGACTRAVTGPLSHADDTRGE
jgi:uncharacterized protein YaiE (UPF0345 family)